MTKSQLPPPPSCERCGNTMAVVGRVPKFAAHPELVTFRCHSCQHVQTQESQGQN